MGFKINPFSGELQLYNEFDSNAFINKIKQLQNSLFIQAFHLSILQNMTLYNLDDGIIDEYEDTSGVDAGNTTAVHDSVNKNYSQDYTFLDEMNYSTDNEVRANYSVEGGVTQKYKKTITIQGQAGLGTNCQVKMLIGESAGASITPSFLDDFSSDLSDWDIKAGSWSIVSGVLETSSTSRPIITTSQFFEQNFEATMKMNFYDGWNDSSDQHGGFIFRMQDTSNYYIFIYDVLRKAWEIWRVVSGGFTKIGYYDDNTVTANTWYNLKINVNGTNIKAKAWKDGDSEPSSWLIDITDTTYNNKSRIGIIGTNEAVTLHFDDFSVISLDTITPDFHLEGNSEKFPTTKGDGGDLRFFDSSLNNELPFWVEKVEGSSPNRIATVWIKVLDNLDSNVSINCFYGDVNSSNYSDPDNTFIFFDDFDGTELDTNKWTIARNGGSYSVSNSKLRITGRFEVIDTVDSFTTSFIAGCNLDLIEIGQQMGFCGYGGSYSFFFIPDGGSDWYVNGSSYGSIITEKNGDNMRLEVTIPDSGNVFLELYRNSIYVTRNVNTIPTGIDMKLRLGGYATDLGSQGSETKDFDYVYIRKYVSSEPQVLSVGNQEPGGYVTFYNDTTNYKRGSSSFKMVTTQSKTLNNIIKRVFSVSKDLSNYDKISFFVRSDYTGNLLSLILKDESSNSIELPFTINNANTWELKSLDFTGSIDKTKIKEYGFKILNDDNNITFNLDYITAQKQSVLESAVITADAQPSTIKVILRATIDGDISYNDYITVYVSRDGGTTWSTADLTIDEEFSPGNYILTTEIDVSSQPAGSSIKYKIVLSADYIVKVEGIGLLWY